MASAIGATGAYERGQGFESELLGCVGLSGNGIIRSLGTERSGLKSTGTMAKSREPVFGKPSLYLIGSVKSLPPVTMVMVSDSDLEPVWDYYVKNFHYLGYQKLLGHRLKYLALIQDHPVAALSWSAPALKITDRDRFIGWSDDQRKTHLDRIANNSRFLILPWVNVRNLASHVLSLNIKRLVKDWEQRFGKKLWLLETFVDPSRYAGTSYKAANWKCIGRTNGFGKQGRGYVHHGSSKEVYVYVVEPCFREIIGCEKKPFRPLHRPASLEKAEELTMILRHTDWNPELVPWMTLTEEDVQNMADELVKFHEQFLSCYGRIEHHRLGLAYISGLISNKEAKSVEPIALDFLGQGGVRPLQRFMKNCRWDHEAMELKNQVMLSGTISDSAGMITTDSCENVKKGKESVGVSRQYCGSMGKVENCQSGVFVGYSSKKGYGLLASRLYMTEVWFSPEYEKRRKDNLVPQDLSFNTKPQIALELIKKIADSKLFDAKWIGCDATFGSDIHFLESLPETYFYFADIRANTQIFLKKSKAGVPPYKGRGRPPKKVKLLPGQPLPQTVAKIARSAKFRWKTVVLAEGAKGPIVAKVARRRVYPSREGLPRHYSVWLFLRKDPDGRIKFSLSNAPKEMPLSEMCEASIMRWPIEQCFEEGKDQLGMDHYEHRSWTAWHRHMIYICLALHFLLRLRIRFKKNSGVDSRPSKEAGGRDFSTSFNHPSGSNRTGNISYTA
jgi:SRSO17 transposase